MHRFMLYHAEQTFQCSDAEVKDFLNFAKAANANLRLSNALMVANAVLVTIMVAVGSSGRRYRHAAVTRFVFLGASTLYLPIISYVVSSIGKEDCGTCKSALKMWCHGRTYLALLLIWTVLVQIVGTNTTALVASADDNNKLGPSIELLARTVWTSCLVFYYSHKGFLTAIRKEDYKDDLDKGMDYALASILAKIMLKFYAFQKASQSVALGLNSRLIAGYTQKLLADDESCRRSILPPLLVMGEDKQKIEETPHGYSIKERNNSLVTVDMVWELTSDALLIPRPWLKDLCLSFALFKLLRRRFEMTHIVDPTKAFSFVLEVLLNSSSPERVFSVLADEVSFVLDSYYSSLPTSNFGRLLPVLNIIISLSIIIWCLFGCAISHRYSMHHPRQIFCIPHPSSCTIPSHYLNDGMGSRVAFGNIIYNVLPTFSLLVLVMIAEAWEITSYLCSNWIKVTILCSYITQPSWQRSPRMQRWLGLILELRIKFRRSWNDLMDQLSLIPANHQQLKMRHGLSWLFLRYSNPRIQHVQVPSAVKAAIVDALRSSNGRLSRGMAALRNSRIRDHLLWVCQGEGTSDVILAWHISTSIFEARHGGTSSTKRTVAIHLSQYCVYLMAAAPELLPDDKAWSKKQYETISKDIERVLAGDEPAEHESMVALLNERSEHELLELATDDDAGWALLANF
ncbi:hypothetical protein PVAP13_7NG369625 [Panicum virgatum]|uniref:DUF4220 domain-containing protein n=1 Tax=Panicum virgatum TaxID=38727 RepID=A0A8T0QFV3_PANVG|nr:hypothetical protein PVAP13_7NG369625 [Panicum virgatum]